MTSNERKHLLESEVHAGKHDADEDNDYYVTKDIKEVPVCCSYRLMVIVCCTLSMTITYAAQASLSSAMVCMIDDRDFPSDSGFYDNLTSQNASNGAFNFTTGNNTDDHSKKWLFKWDKTDQALAISTFFMGYYISQIPSSIAAARFGPKRVVVISLLLVSLFQGLAVPAAYYGIGWFYADRVIVGIIDGFLYAPTFALAGQWAPRHETSLLFGIVGMGMELGNVLSYAVSLLACEIDVQEGWPFVFYILAGLGMIIALIVTIIVSDSPFTNRHVSREEVKFFLSCIPKRHHGPAQEPAPVPVKEILTSGCVWAIVVSQIGSDWLYYFFVTMEPTFLKDVIKLSPLQVNLLTGLPFLGIIPTIYLSGYLCDKLVTRGVVSNTKVRKFNDFICKIIPSAILIGLGFLPQESVAAAFVLNLFGAMCMGFSYVSWMANPVDLAPAYTGFIVGICEIGAIWVSIAVPIIFDEITLDKTRAEWQLVFYITAGIQVFCFLFYAVFASGELQPWAFSTSKHDYDVLDGQDDVKPALLDDALTSKSLSKSTGKHGQSKNDESQRLLSSLSLSLGGFQGTSSYEASEKRKKDLRKSEGNIGTSTVVISGPAVTRTLLQSGHIPKDSLLRQESLYRGASIDALFSEIKLGKPLPEFNVPSGHIILSKPTNAESFGSGAFEIENYIESDDDSWQNFATRSLPSNLTRSVLHGHGEHDLHLIMSSPHVSDQYTDDELPGPPRNTKSLATEIVETLTDSSLNEPVANMENTKSKSPVTKLQNRLFPNLKIHGRNKNLHENNAALTKRQNGNVNLRATTLYVDPKYTRNITNMKRGHYSSFPRLVKGKQVPRPGALDSGMNYGDTSSIMVSTEDSRDSAESHRKQSKSRQDLKDINNGGHQDQKKISRVVKRLFSFKRSKSNPDANLPSEETFVFVNDNEVDDEVNFEPWVNKSLDSVRKTKQSSPQGQKSRHEEKALKPQGDGDAEGEQVLFVQPRGKI